MVWRKRHCGHPEPQLGHDPASLATALEDVRAEAKEFVATHKNSILWVDSDAQLIHLIETTPGAVGLVDVRSITKTVSVLKVDGKLPLEDGYLPH